MSNLHLDTHICMFLYTDKLSIDGVKVERSIKQLFCYRPFLKKEIKYQSFSIFTLLLVISLRSVFKPRSPAIRQLESNSPIK